MWTFKQEMGGARGEGRHTSHGEMCTNEGRAENNSSKTMLLAFQQSTDVKSNSLKYVHVLSGAKSTFAVGHTSCPCIK